MPRGQYIRKTHEEKVARLKELSRVKTEAVMARWDSVQQEQENWIKPFRELDTERAMRYLEDLRKICEQAGVIMNERLNPVNGKIFCAGPGCSRNVTGLNPNGMPKWIAKMDFKDKKNPEIWHCLYFCSELCKNQFTRKNMGNAVSDGR